MRKKFDFLYERKKKQHKQVQIELELPLIMPNLDGFKKKLEEDKPEEERGVVIIPL